MDVLKFQLDRPAILVIGSEGTGARCSALCTEPAVLQYANKVWHEPSVCRMMLRWVSDSIVGSISKTHAGSSVEHDVSRVLQACAQM